jgi:hypothetical protein
VAEPLAETPTELPFATRIWFAWVCFFRVLFDARFAARALEAQRPSEPREAAAALPPAPAPPAEKPEPPTTTAALQLLSLLQREGRLVDFLEQDIARESDADIGAAARAVHAGCRRALRQHVKVAPVRAEDEGARVKLEKGFNPFEVKLSGDVSGAGPHAGVLRHRGWRVEEVTLPTPMKGHDATILYPAEVEL